MKTPIILFDERGKRLASGWLTALDGPRGLLAIDRGGAHLRAAYFLDGCRTVRCLIDSQEVEARLYTCWADNYRQWTVAFPERPLPVEGALSVSGLVPVEAA